MRDNIWLKNKLENIWAVYFADVSRENEVKIEFGRKARTRLGSIKLSQKSESRARAGSINNLTIQQFNHSIITITGYFQDENVPEFMLDAVIAHELCHYAHGFSSPLPQLFKHPHLGSTVDHEMIKRGLGDTLLTQRKWLKNEWKGIIGPAPRRRRVVRRRRRMSFLQLLISNS